MTSSNGKHRVTDLCEGNPPVTGGFPSQRPVMRCFDDFLDMRLNKLLNKQWSCRWFVTPRRSLWRHCNVSLLSRIFPENASYGNPSYDNDEAPSSNGVIPPAPPPPPGPLPLNGAPPPPHPPPPPVDTAPAGTCILISKLSMHTPTIYRTPRKFCARFVVWWNYVIASQRSRDDLMKWKYFPRYWPFVRGIHRPPVNSPHKGQWRGALVFSLICAWINGWVNNRKAGGLRRHRAHFDVIVMDFTYIGGGCSNYNIGSVFR